MKTYLFFILALLLSSCATSYHQKSFTGGYADFQLEENIFKVSFKGNNKTSMERAVDFALLRSAEITLANGYNYFTIINRNQYTKKQWHYSHSNYYPYLQSKPRVFYTIKCFDEKPEKNSYNAKLIIKSLRDKYRLYKEIPIK